MDDLDKVSLMKVNELFRQAATLVQEGRLGEALIVCDSAIQINPAYADSYNNRGVVLKYLDRPHEAVTAYQQAIRLNPNLAGTHFNLGDVLRDTGHLEEALASYQNAIELNPQYADAYYQKANLLVAMGRMGIAITTLESALRYNPELETAKYLLATLGVRAPPTASPKNYVRNLFDSCADRFDHILVEQLKYKIPELLFDAVIDNLHPTQSKLDILDLGCGTGLCGTRFSGHAKNLTGVDLSPRMLAKARKRNCYTKLIQDDICQALEQIDLNFDLTMAADVFIYIGKLDKIFSLVSKHLNPSGLFAFSIESNTTGEDYRLRMSGRYAQSTGYIQCLAKRNGFEVIHSRPVTVRYERQKPVAGNLFILRIAK